MKPKFRKLFFNEKGWPAGEMILGFDQWPGLSTRLFICKIPTNLRWHDKDRLRYVLEEELGLEI